MKDQRFWAMKHWVKEVLPTAPIPFPRNRWLRAEQPIAMIGMMMNTYGMFTPCYQQFVATYNDGQILKKVTDPELLALPWLPSSTEDQSAPAPQGPSASGTPFSSTLRGPQGVT